MKYIIIFLMVIMLNNCKDITSSQKILPAPYQLKIMHTDSKSISIQWSANSENIEWYKIYRRNVNELNYNVIALSNKTTCSYTDSSVVAREMYYYKVKSCNSFGESISSNIVSAYAMAPTINLRAMDSTINIANSVEIFLNIYNLFIPANNISFRIKYNSDLLSFYDSSGFIINSLLERNAITFVKKESSTLYCAISLKQGTLPIGNFSKLCVFSFIGVSSGKCIIKLEDSSFFLFDSLGNRIKYSNLKFDSAQIVIQ